MNAISIYTDGSCNQVTRSGAWVAIILSGAGKTILKGLESDTTHQRMELTAVIRSMEYLHKNAFTRIPVTLYSDSQYVVGLSARKERLQANQFFSETKKVLPNADLLSRFYTLNEGIMMSCVKIKAHAKKGAELNFNREADMLCRKMVRKSAG